MNEFLNGLNPGIPVLSIAVLAVVIGAWASGRILTHSILRMSFRHPFPETVVNFAVGLDLLAFIILPLASFGFLNRFSAWCVPLAAILAASIIGGRRACDDLFATIANFKWRKHRALLIPALFLLAGLGSALCYPFGWDELTYHIELPSRWLQDGSLSVYSDNPYSGFPSLVEILSAAGIRMGGILFPRTLNLCVCAVLLSAFWILLRRYATHAIAAVGTAVLAVSPLFLTLARETYVESFMSLNFVCALLVLHFVRGNRNASDVSSSRAALLGILAGGALAMKLSGAVVPLIIALVWFVEWSTGKKWKRNGGENEEETHPNKIPAAERRENADRAHTPKLIHALAVLATITFLFAIPFYLRPWIQTGNPNHPYFAELFTDDPVALLVSAKHHLMASRYGTHGILGFLASPVALAYRRDLFDAIVVGWQLPICLALFICVWGEKTFAGGSKNLKSLWIAATLAFCLLFWYSTAQQSRFALPLLILAILAGFSSLRYLTQKTAAIMLALICAGALFSLEAPQFKHFYFGWKRHCLGWLTNEVYLKKALGGDGYVDAMRAVLEHTPKNAKVALLFERRCFYCPRKHVIATPIFQSALFTPPPGSPEAVIRSLRFSEIDYLLFGGTLDNPDISLEDVNRAAKLADFLAKLAHRGEIQPIWSKNGYNLFRIRYTEDANQ